MQSLNGFFLCPIHVFKLLYLVNILIISMSIDCIFSKKKKYVKKMDNNGVNFKQTTIV